MSSKVKSFVLFVLVSFILSALCGFLFAAMHDVANNRSISDLQAMVFIGCVTPIIGFVIARQVQWGKKVWVSFKS